MTHRAFRRFQELGIKHHGLKNLSMTKQNKKQCNLDIEDYLLLFLKNWQPETLIFHISEIVFCELATRPHHGTLANMSPLD
jgi:hypothetical protein